MASVVYTASSLNSSQPILISQYLTFKNNLLYYDCFLYRFGRNRQFGIIGFDLKTPLYRTWPKINDKRKGITCWSVNVGCDCIVPPILLIHFSSFKFFFKLKARRREASRRNEIIWLNKLSKWSVFIFSQFKILNS